MSLKSLITLIVVTVVKVVTDPNHQLKSVIPSHLFPSRPFRYEIPYNEIRDRFRPKQKIKETAKLGRSAPKNKVKP